MKSFRLPLFRCVYRFGYVGKYFLDSAGTFYGAIFALFDIVITQRGCGLMVNIEAVLYCLDIVIGTPGLHPALYHTVNQLTLRDLQTYNMMKLLPATLEKPLQGISLRHCTGESVEDNTILGLRFMIDNILKDFYHQRIRDELPLVDICLCNLANRRFACNMVAQHFARGDMVQTIPLNQHFTLGPFSTARGAKNNYIHNRILFIQLPQK